MAAALRKTPTKLPLFPTPRFSTTLSSQSPAQTSPDSIARAKSAIRSEPDPDRLAALFQSSTHSPLFHGDRVIYKLSVQKLAASRRPDLIERLLDHQISDPDSPKSEGFIIRLISLYSQAGMVDHAVRTFDRMPELGCQRTERSLCALLTVFLKNRLLDRLLESFHRTPQEIGITPGITAHNIVLKGFCDAGDLTAARKMLDEMSKKDLKPDLVSYNTVLNGYLKIGDEVGFEEILKGIQEPNVVTYNCRIAGLCQKGRSFEAEELLNAMSSKGVEPNRLSFNTVIDGFCKEGDVKAAMRVFERMKSTKKGDGSCVSPSFETYIVLVRSLVEKGEFGSALEVFKECVTRKWAPPFEAVKGLVEGLTKDSRVDEAKDVVAEMRKAVKGDAMEAWKKIEGSLSL